MFHLTLNKEAFICSPILQSFYPPCFMFSIIFFLLLAFVWPKSPPNKSISPLYYIESFMLSFSLFGGYLCVLNKILSIYKFFDCGSFFNTKI